MSRSATYRSQVITCKRGGRKSSVSVPSYLWTYYVRYVAKTDAKAVDMVRTMVEGGDAVNSYDVQYEMFLQIIEGVKAGARQLDLLSSGKNASQEVEA